MPLMRILALVGSVWLWAVPEIGSSHPLDPALLEIVSRQGRFEILWKAPLGRQGSVVMRPVLPESCTLVSPPALSETGGTFSQRWTVDCGKEGLVGERIGIQGLGDRGTDALVRIRLDDGGLIQAVLRPNEPFLTVPETSTPVGVFLDYLKLGIEHILTGVDHLVFILGLVLLVHGWRLLLWTITSFTVGHSVTLSLAVLGLLNVPSAPVEALIALSIFVVAIELLRDLEGRPSWMQRFPWTIAIGFGLLHGLGFAGALAEAGLPENEIPLALFSFNIGIEAGQLLFVAIVILARMALASAPVRWPKKAEQVPAYAVGSLAAFWVFERTSTIF